MFIYVERLADRVADCDRPTHGGTYAPAPADVLAGGELLCLHHFVAGLPVAPELVA